MLRNVFCEHVFNLFVKKKDFYPEKSPYLSAWKVYTLISKLSIKL